MKIQAQIVGSDDTIRHRYMWTSVEVATDRERWRALAVGAPSFSWGIWRTNNDYGIDNSLIIQKTKPTHTFRTGTDQ